MTTPDQLLAELRRLPGGLHDADAHALIARAFHAPCTDESCPDCLSARALQLATKTIEKLRGERDRYFDKSQQLEGEIASRDATLMEIKRLADEAAKWLADARYLLRYQEISNLAHRVLAPGETALAAAPTHPGSIQAGDGLKDVDGSESPSGVGAAAALAKMGESYSDLNHALTFDHDDSCAVFAHGDRDCDCWCMWINRVIKRISSGDPGAPTTPAPEVAKAADLPRGTGDRDSRGRR